MNRIYKQEINALNRNKKQILNDNYTISLLLIICCIVGAILSINNNVYAVFFIFILGLLVGSYITRTMAVSKLVDSISKIIRVSKNKR